MPRNEFHCEFTATSRIPPILKQTFKILTFKQLKHLDLCSDYNIQNSSQWNPITVFSNNIETILFTSKCFLIFNVKNALFCLSLYFLFFLSFFFFHHRLEQKHSPGQNTGVDSLSLSRGSPQPRDQTQVFCIAGGFFIS